MAVFKLSMQNIDRIGRSMLRSNKKHKKVLEKLHDTFGNNPELYLHYVEPECQQDNPANSDEAEASSQVKSPVFKTLNDFFSKRFRINDGRNQLMVLADAGMGKTSLLFILRLQHLFDSFPKNYKCHLLKIGPSSLDDINSIRDKSSTVLLLDSLDEDPDVLGRERERLIELLEATKDFHRTIISCRTQFFPTKDEADIHNIRGYIEVGNFRCPLIYLSLFNDEQVKEYLHKRFPQKFFDKLKNRNNSQYDEALQIVRKMGSLKCRPLLLSHIEDLLDPQHSINTEYDIYSVLVERWLKRELLKRPHEKNGISYDQLLHGCMYLAESMQRDRRRSVSEKELDDLIFEASSLKLIKGFNFGGRSLINRKSNRDYRFSHYSIQEFLCAFAWVENKLKTNERIFVTNLMLRLVIGSGKKVNRLDNVYVTASQLDLIENVFYIKKRLFGLNIVKSKLYNQEVKWKNYEACKFEGVVFEGVSFANSTFRECSFDQCTFINCNIKTGRYFSCKFTRCRFESTKLHGGLFKECVINRCGFKLTSFEHKEFIRTKLINSIFSRIEVKKGNLEKTLFQNNKFSGLKFIEADLTEVGIYSNTGHASTNNRNAIGFDDCKLIRVSYKDNNMTTYISDTVIENSGFSNSKFVQSMIVGSRLRGVVLDGNDFNEMTLDKSILFAVYFRCCDIEQMNVIETDIFKGCVFSEDAKPVFLNIKEPPLYVNPNVDRKIVHRIANTSIYAINVVNVIDGRE